MRRTMNACAAVASVSIALYYCVGANLQAQGQDAAATTVARVEPPANPFPWPLVTASIGVVGTLSGTFLGGWLTSRRDAKAKQAKSAAVRQMLQTEIQHNLDQLREYSSGALPVQSHQIWQSQLEAVPASLTADQVQRVHNFYYELYGLKKLADARSDKLDGAIRKLLENGNPL